MVLIGFTQTGENERVDVNGLEREREIEMT